MSQTTANQTNLIQMADILMPPSPESSLLVWLILAGILIICVIFILLWWYFMQPLTQLQRQLKQGKLSTREAAHQLAHLANTEIKLQHQIDRLRFQRQTPEFNELLILINKVRHGR